MKKTGKALSLVLSLALVASSIPMAFASAATNPGTNDATGAAVTFDTGDSELALAVDKTSPSATDKMALPTPTITYTDAATGRQYVVSTTAADDPTVTWTSADPSTAKISTDKTGVIPVKAGETTLTCTYSADKPLYYAHATADEKTVKVTASKSVKVKVYNTGDYVLTDATPVNGVVPTATTKLAVNAAPTYALYTVSEVGTGDASAKFGAYGTAPAGSVLGYASEKGKVIPAVAAGTAPATTGVVTVQQPDPDKLYLGNDEITACLYKGDGTTHEVSKLLASVPVQVVKEYDVPSTVSTAVAISGDTAYGSSKTTVAGYDVTGYDIVYEGTGDLTLSNAKVGNVTAAKAATGDIKVDGGSVASITTPATCAATVTIDNATSKNSATVGDVTAAGAVTVTNDDADKVTTKVGNIASDAAVTVSGKGATVGNVNAKGAIGVTGATTGSLTGVPTYKAGTQSTAVTADYPTVTVKSATVNGDITGNAIVVDGTVAAGEDAAVPATVNGNVNVYSNTTTPAETGSAIIGGSDATTPVDANVTVTGTVKDMTGGGTITVLQNYDTTTKKITNKVTVGGINGFAPEKASDPYTTNVSFVNFTGSFASLPNVNNVTVDANSDVKVASAVTSRHNATPSTLTVDGVAEFGGATFDNVTGTGTIKMPAGSLTANVGFTEVSPAQITFESTTPLKAGDVLFNSVAGMKNAVKVNGVEVDSKASATVANGYEYYAKTVGAVGVAISGDGVADKKLSVPAGNTVTLNADVTPSGQTIPDGEKIAWDISNNNSNITLTPSADGKTATVKATGYDALDANGINDVTVKAYITDADGNKDYKFNEDSVAVSAAKAIELTGVTVSPATAEVKADAPATLTVASNPANAQLPADAKITWASDNDSFTVTPSADGKTAMVSIAKAPEKDTTADVTVKVNDFTATAKVTAKAATTPVPVQSNFTIDSMPKTMKLGQVYTVKIASKDGSKPSYAFANNFAAVTKVATKGNDTYLTFTAQSEGAHGVYVGGKKVAVINVAGSICDTRTVTVKQGKTYQFKVTSPSTPNFTIATVGTLKPVKVNGHDYYYKVTATSNKGDHGVYVNGAKIAHCIFA